MEYKIVVVNSDGKIIGVKPYSQDGNRDENVAAAIDALVAELGIDRPDKLPRSRGVRAADGNEWGRMSADVAVGMVEVGFGKWGFA